MTAPADANARATVHARERHALTRLTAITLVSYAIGIAVVMAVNRVRITPDVFVVFLAIGALLVGRGWAFVRDWLPFIAILLAWEAMRGLADNFGAAVHSDSIIAAERAISFGVVPPVALQQALYDPQSVSILDAATSIVYFAHFAFPLIVAFFFWLRDRSRYYRFAATLLAMSIAGFVFFLVFPVAPPRFAGEYGAEALPVHDIARETMHKLDIQAFASWAYANMSGNEVAAFPSLHSAYPMLALLFVRNERRTAIVVLCYAAAVWFSVVYLGHHYVVDVLGGVALAILAYVVLVRSGLLDRALTGIGAELGGAPDAESREAHVAGAGTQQT